MIDFVFSRNAIPILCVSALALFPTPAFADELQQQVLAFAKTVTDTDFAFTQTSSNQRSGEAAKEYVLRYDPRRAAGTRWAVVRFEGRAPTPKETGQVTKQANKGKVASYGHIAKWFGSPAKRIATGNGTVTYRFAQLPKGTITMGSHDASADTVAEVVVNISGKMPFVERARYVSTKAFRMMMVAKVEKFESVTIYRMFDNGKPMVVGSATEMSGSMLGKSGSFKSRNSYGEITPR